MEALHSKGTVPKTQVGMYGQETESHENFIMYNVDSFIPYVLPTHALYMSCTQFGSLKSSSINKLHIYKYNI